jgi:hypothetical protein
MATSIINAQNIYHDNTFGQANHWQADTIFSDCEQYRYRLWRGWDKSRHSRLHHLGLNQEASPKHPLYLTSKVKPARLEI